MPVADLDLERLDTAVEAAIRAGEAGDLNVLGYGEITLVLGWPSESPRVAVKRLPAFRDPERLRGYAALLDGYATALRERGVEVVPTDVRWLAVPGGELHAYLVQPLVPRERLLHTILRGCSRQEAAALLETLAGHVAAAVDARLGLDAQAANWAVEGERMALVDVSTPMVRDGDGRDALDLEPFLSIYPWALRAVLRPIAHSIMDQYHDPRTVLLDVASNLHKEKLDGWLPEFLAAANAHVARPLTEREVRRYFARDKALWLTMQRLRRLDRAWQTRLRHRAYPFLLAPPYRYAPHPLPREEDGMTVIHDLPATNDEAFELIARHLSPHKAKAFRDVGIDLVQGRREGVRVWDLQGRDYINCRSSGGVFNFGHHPAFAVEALQAALAEHDMGDWLLPSARRARGAEALARLLPDSLPYTFFTASGAEAVEVACKLARSVTGRAGLVSAEHGYHGHVGFSLAMDDPPLSERFRPLTPGITRVPFGDLEALDAAIGEDTAAAIMETIPATGGYLIPPEGYFPAMRGLCDERGALMILDEVQTGLGRTGRVWALEHFGAVPDILITGKGTSAGVYPIAGCCFGERAEAHFAQDPFFHPSSFAGSELGARVIEAVVGRYEDPELLANVEAMGTRMRAGFDELAARHPDRVVGHRGLGLMLALETPSDAHGFELTRQCFAHGLLAIFAFNRQSTLQVMPPLVISAAEVDDVLERLDAALGAMEV